MENEDVGGGGGKREKRIIKQNFNFEISMKGHSQRFVACFLILSFLDTERTTKEGLTSIVFPFRLQCKCGTQWMGLPAKETFLNCTKAKQAMVEAMVIFLMLTLYSILPSKLHCLAFNCANPVKFVA